VQISDPHFCEGCGKLQPLAPGTDYFAFMSLPRKLTVDVADLEKRFYDLSRRLHPDYFMNSTPEERRVSMDRASMLNDAYRTLREPVPRARYLLNLEGYKEAEKKAPPDLLEEVFELNMQIEELKQAKKMGDQEEAATATGSLRTTLDGLQEKLSAIDRQLLGLFADLDTANAKHSVELRKKTLDNTSELLSHRAYIRNLIDEIEEEISEDAGY
jgi:molecular chaperone HscB